MDRYAVLNDKNEVVNVIAWDGIANWSPPVGHEVLKNEDCAIGDIWIKEFNEFVRLLSKLKPPEDEISISQRKEAYLEAKTRLKSSMLFLDQNGEITA